MTLPSIRRIVTGHDSAGRSVVSHVGPPPHEFTLDVVNVEFHELWNTQQMPVPLCNGPEPVGDAAVLAPPANGTRLRIIDIPPDTPELLARGGDAMRDVFDAIGDGAASTATRHPAMHRTESIDYGIVLDGEMTLLLDEEEIDVRVGDVVIQRGTNHAWANRSGAVCRILFVLIAGTFEPELRASVGDAH